MAETVREMLISHDPSETRVAVLEDGKLVEYYIERAKRSVVGNVYLGRVKDVLPGMQAAFVDIGLEKNAFLYVDEVVSAEGIDDVPRRDIRAMLKPGQQIMVQVLKDPMGTKGARVTTDVTLPGRFVVLMPFSDFIGISKKLPDAERERLHAVVSAHRRVGREREGPSRRPRLPPAPLEARSAPGTRGASARGHLHGDGPRAPLRPRRLRGGLPAAADRRPDRAREGDVLPAEDLTRARAPGPPLP
jgi:hypothetical protein